MLLLLWGYATLTVKEIGEKLLLESVTPLLKRLEKKQWISRTRDPQDDRSVMICLCEEGWMLREKAGQIPGRMRQKMAMDAGEVAQLNQLFIQLK